METKVQELFELIKSNQIANEKVLEDLKYRVALIETSGPHRTAKSGLKTPMFM